MLRWITTAYARMRRRTSEPPPHEPFTQCLMIGCKNHTGITRSGRRI